MSGKYDPVSSSGGNSVGGPGGASIPLVGLGPNPGYFAGGAPAAAAGSNSGSYQNYAVNMGSGQQAAVPAAAGIAAAGSVKPSKQQQPSGVAGIGQPALTSTGPGFSDQHSAPQTFGGSGGAPFVVAPTAPLSFMGAWQAALWGTGDSMAIVKCGNIGVRLVRRKLLFEARRKIGTLAFFVGALGLVIVYAYSILFSSILFSCVALSVSIVDCTAGYSDTDVRDARRSKATTREREKEKENV